MSSLRKAATDVVTAYDTAPASSLVKRIETLRRELDRDRSEGVRRTQAFRRRRKEPDAPTS